MTSRVYPDEAAGPFHAPPYSFTDGEGREIEIRAYREEFEPVVEMYVAFDPADRAQGIPPSREDRIRDWLETILAEGCDVLAWHGDRVVGHATLVPDNGDAYELAIFVLQEYQGAGIGTELITSLLGYGDEEGVDRVWLTVERWNTPAIELYRKVGFEPSETESFELEMAIRLDRQAGDS